MWLTLYGGAGRETGGRTMGNGMCIVSASHFGASNGPSVRVESAAAAWFEVATSLLFSFLPFLSLYIFQSFVFLFCQRNETLLSSIMHWPRRHMAGKQAAQIIQSSPHIQLYPPLPPSHPSSSSMMVHQNLLLQHRKSQPPI